ncbi:putative multiple-sugar transport system permease YteP [Robinsoniella peoriensis]|uniref:Putative multiple-sugar transport system permease YteP n=2 Tax=Robinsoniella peoriensis TaxID=180332 RepID=A0A4U8QAW3_9FIRM|nr:putative multiple-sugar transport system permease YteP [Robinsoniella peoriensis]
MAFRKVNGTEQGTAAIAAAGRKKSKRVQFRKWLPVFIMMAPALIYLLINNYLPMLGLVIAFKKVNFSIGIFQSPWCGLDNFKFLFNTSDAWTITRNTLLYNFAFIIVNTLMGILIAVLISEIRSKKGKTIYQSSVLLPFLMSYVIVSYIVYALFSGDNGMLNNTILPAFGMEPVNWYAEAKYWPVILVVVNCWKGVGYGTLIYIAAIAGIDSSYYEAAALDGAGKLKQIFYVTLPALVPSIITLTLLNIGRIFYSDFSLFYQVPMNSGMLYATTQTIDTYVYRGLLTLGDVGMSSAAGFYQSCVGFILVMVSNLIVKKISPDNALF